MSDNLHNSLTFNITATDNLARVGIITTSRSCIETPVFMPVGTAGTVKAMMPHEVSDIGYRIILANTYHLYLRPSHQVIQQLGGLHRFMNWPYSLLTDSGGYQVFSLAKLRKIEEQGVTFQSHIDGSTHILTPELSMQIQHALGSDIIMAFDECSPHDTDNTYWRKSMDMTTRWLMRCIQEHQDKPGNLFGIIQGGMNIDLRKEHAQTIASFHLPGIAIGGLSVGENKEIMYEMIQTIMPHLPINKPRYLMGVGELDDILFAVEHGIDMFDCVIPTRLARNGSLFTYTGNINIRNQQHRESDLPIDESCSCLVCKHYSRAYLRHLLQSQEILYHRLATYHNLYFYYHFIKRICESISEKRFLEFKKQFLDHYQVLGKSEHEL